MNVEDNLQILNALGIELNGKSSGNILVSCPEPDHDDKKPSCSISIDKGIYHCFSCGASGHITQLYYNVFGVSPYKGLNLNISPEYIRPVRRQNKTEFNFDDVPKTHFKAVMIGGNISNYRSGLDWIKQRGLTEDVCSKARIKFAESITVTDLEDNNRKPMVLQDSIYIPIFENNTLISFEARSVKKDSENFKKVLYPYCSSVNTLYNLKNLDTKSTLYLTEGLLDCLSLWTNPLTRNATAIFRNIPTERQIYLLSKFNDIVYVVDNDLRGALGCKKLMERLPNKVKYLRPPKSVKDINDILQGKDDRLKSIQDLIDRNWLSRTSSDINKLLLVV